MANPPSSGSGGVGGGGTSKSDNEKKKKLPHEVNNGLPPGSDMPDTPETRNWNPNEPATNDVLANKKPLGNRPPSINAGKDGVVPPFLGGFNPFQTPSYQQPTKTLTNTTPLNNNNAGMGNYTIADENALAKYQQQIPVGSGLRGQQQANNLPTNLMGAYARQQQFLGDRATNYGKEVTDLGNGKVRVNVGGKSWVQDKAASERPYDPNWVSGSTFSEPGGPQNRDYRINADGSKSSLAIGEDYRLANEAARKARVDARTARSQENYRRYKSQQLAQDYNRSLASLPTGNRPSESTRLQKKLEADYTYSRAMNDLYGGPRQSISPWNAKMQMEALTGNSQLSPREQAKRAGDVYSSLTSDFVNKPVVSNDTYTAGLRSSRTATPADEYVQPDAVRSADEARAYQAQLFDYESSFN